MDCKTTLRLGQSRNYSGINEKPLHRSPKKRRSPPCIELEGGHRMSRFTPSKKNRNPLPTPIGSIDHAGFSIALFLSQCSVRSDTGKSFARRYTGTVERYIKRATLVDSWRPQYRTSGVFVKPILPPDQPEPLVLPSFTHDPHLRFDWKSPTGRCYTETPAGQDHPSLRICWCDPARGCNRPRQGQSRRCSIGMTPCSISAAT